MERFNADAICPKCGHDQVGVFWCAGGCYTFRQQDECCKTEHLHRTCQRCRYTWCEACLASEEA